MPSVVKPKKGMGFRSHSRTDWHLFTGQPGCGKTTSVKTIAKHLASYGVRLRGFVTEEVLGANGTRVGFDVVTLPGGKRSILSRKGGPSGQPKTGAYSVDIASFERLALPTLAADNDPRAVYCLDEIGRMELHSAAFAARVEALLRRGVRLLGAITAPIYGHRVPFCDQVSASSGVAVCKLTAKVRDDVTALLRDELIHRWCPSKACAKSKEVAKGAKAKVVLARPRPKRVSGMKTLKKKTAGTNKTSLARKRTKMSAKRK